MNKKLELPLYIQKYLQKYGLQNWNLINNFDHKINLAVVIPAIAEFDNIKILLNSILNNESKFINNTAIIFVINNIQKSSDEIKENNKNTITYFENIIDKNPQDEIQKRIIEQKINLGFIDASSQGNELPEKDGGVGLARKIGMDLALSIFNYDSNQKNILLCLDADCTISKNYIDEIYDQFNKRKISAASINFEHKIEGELENQFAILNYENFLRYYVLGLNFANSPYAFHTVGSSMACDVESYVKIGGMNKKKAAEDFYFLEKLAKVVKVENINSVTVFPSSRGSWRVPFGTGQRVNRYLSKIQNENVLYDPESFEILKNWNEIFLKNKIEIAEFYLNSAKSIHNELYNFLNQNEFEKNWNQILSNSKNEIQINKQKQIWFDGFKTLKLIHYLRDTKFTQKPMFIALNELFEKMNIKIDFKGEDEFPSIKIQKLYLQKLRELQS